MGWFTNAKQRQVLRLEPSRGASAFAHLLLFVVAATFSAVVIVELTDSWPADVRRPDLAGISDQALVIAASVAAAFAIGALCAGVYDLSRWRLARRVIRASSTPLFRNAMPSHETVVAAERAPAPPPLTVEIRKPRHLPKTPKPLHRVSTERNVIGLPPINIAYLRLFDNQPRARTFLESAWREFGYVFLLRSATSVTRKEFKHARQQHSLDDMFVADDDQFGATLQVARHTPLRKGRLVLPDVAPTRVRVRDPYGSYPIRAVLCHGDYWKRAVDVLLGQVHLVVLDLSGFTSRNAATAYELQRTIDVVPIERVILLCDPRSSKGFLRSAVEDAWQRMAATSPNATGAPKAATIAVTDAIRTYRSEQGNQEVTQTRLESSRRRSRRVAAFAHQRALRTPRTQPTATSNAG